MNSLGLTCHNLLSRDFLEINFFTLLGSGIGTFIVQKLYENHLRKQFLRYSTLYSEKLSVVKNIYRLIVKLEKSLDLILSRREPTEISKKMVFHESTFMVFEEFVNYYEENEIFLGDSLVKEINNVTKSIKEAKEAHLIATFAEDSRGSDFWLEAITNKNELFKSHIDNFPNLKNKLKLEFRTFINQ